MAVTNTTTCVACRKALSAKSWARELSTNTNYRRSRGESHDVCTPRDKRAVAWLPSEPEIALRAMRQDGRPLVLDFTSLHSTDISICKALHSLNTLRLMLLKRCIASVWEIVLLIGGISRMRNEAEAVMTWACFGPVRRQGYCILYKASAWSLRMRYSVANRCCKRCERWIFKHVPYISQLLASENVERALRSSQ